MTEHDPAVPCDRVGADELRPGDPTPGMTRQVALHTGGMWSGTVDTEAGATSGWHHHGDHDTTIYVGIDWTETHRIPGNRLVELGAQVEI